jgi:uncharacterized protein YydD (DUF2326 family)
MSKKRSNSKIFRKGDQAIAALLSEPTHEQAAAKAGISPATLQRWLNDPEFQKRYREARHRVFDEAVASLESASGQAVKKLVERLKSAKEGDEIKAADLLLAYSFRARELLDHEGRIAELEGIIQELKQDEQKRSQT